MNYKIDDIDYEDLDGLALADHIEWNSDEAEEFSIDALDLIDE